MKQHLNKYKKGIAFIMAAVMLCGCTGILAYAAGAKNSSNTSASTDNTKTTTDNETDSKDSNVSTNSKDETVYVIANADGSAKKVIVSDWIKNALNDSKLTDSTSLDNISNTKDDTSYQMDGDHARVWDAEGKDVYYQGDISKELPVDVTVSYQLDGKTISADELAGKSGKVTIRFDYSNKQSEDVEIDGVKTKIYVPFVMFSGMVLDNDQFSNVQVTNGKVVNDGDRTMVIGLALPGMQDNLGIEKDTFEVPDYVEINADVTHFKLTTTLTLATNEIFNDFNPDDIKGVDSLKGLSGKMDDLSDAMGKLMDGSSKLYDGISALLDKSGALIDGIDKLAAGAGQLKDGAGSLKDGAGKLQSGIDTLTSGLDTLTENNDSLNQGAGKIFDTLLTTADSELSQAGLSAGKLTVDNYDDILTGVINSLDEVSIRKMAYNKALETVTESVRAQKSVIREKVTEAAKSKVLEGVLQAAGQKMTAEQYQAAVTAGKIPSEQQAKISAIVDTQMKTDEIQSQIDKNTEAQIQNLITQTMKGNEVTAKIEEAVKKAKSGADSILTLKTQLDKYNEFYQGLLLYTTGVKQADTGAKALSDGSSKLTAGASSLTDGADSLCSGLGEMKKGGSKLVNGITQLKDGSMQLSNGLSDFNKEGVQKLVDAMNGDLGGLVSRIRATIDVSKNYKSFSGKSDQMDGKVRFIYRTDTIEK